MIPTGIRSPGGENQGAGQIPQGADKPSRLDFGILHHNTLLGAWAPEPFGPRSRERTRTTAKSSSRGWMRARRRCGFVLFVPVRAVRGPDVRAVRGPDVRAVRGPVPVRQPRPFSQTIW